jgi:hypothetical protein
MRCSFMIFYSDKHERDLDTGYQNLCYQLPQNIMNRIGVVMVSVLSSSVVDDNRVFVEHRSGQTKDYTIWYLLLLR